MKHQWATITEDQEERFHAFRDFKSLIEKDVSRTDRTLDFFKGDNSKGTDTLRNILMTYMMYHFNLGYVQGMSDILAPILMEIQDEIMTFWLFAKFMDRIHPNFELSQESMQKQLKDSYMLLQIVDPRLGAYLDACDASNMYFGFRWLLIWFKREFTYSDVLILWESLWTGLPGVNYPLFVGLSILIQNRSTVMENKFGLSEILRHVNDLSMRIDLEKTLALAEALYRQVMAVEAKLPNAIRTIIGLPEIEEPALDNLEVVQGPSASPRQRKSTSPSPCPEPGGSNLSVPNENSNLSTSPDVEALENQYELGVTQFM
ncbi:GTPase-activating protein GYP7 [Folsomia candida]|uniref:GTPase-activating protein GYP7 n=2 Tax=Folsomia candida TaxID=158441 RepID=A0A226F1M9_FOLCA|nr:GTPase-activating protein GYP7 [Folsomia candida]